MKQRIVTVNITVKASSNLEAERMVLDRLAAGLAPIVFPDFEIDKVREPDFIHD